MRIAVRDVESLPSKRFGGSRPQLSRILFVCIAAATLGACASADVAAINKASQSAIDSANVSEVNVTMNTPKPNPQLEATLRRELMKALSECATGPNEHFMNVTVEDFEDQDVAKTIFIGDEIELEGTVELVDAQTGQQTGEYYISRGFFWGGFIGAAMMSEAESRLSEDFAESVCEEVFGADTEDRSRVRQPGS